jgi:hypothetical protein
MEVHRILGPGFLEAVYQGALERELNLGTLPFERKMKLPVIYKDVVIGDYEAQAMHYLAATGLRLALLLNFGASSLEHRRIIK